MKLDKSEIINEIKSSSMLGYSNKISIIDVLLKACWCEENDLVKSYNIIDNADLDIALVFFQLPFLIKLPEKWFHVRSEYGNPYIYFRPIGTIYNQLLQDSDFKIGSRKSYGEIEKFTNAMLQEDYYGLLTKTQVIISFQLWGKRQTYYQKYLHTLNGEHLFKSVIVNKEDSWKKDHSAITGATYEGNLARRLEKQAIIVLREFIPKYSIACKDPYARNYNIHALNQLNSYFMMVKSGRVVVQGAGQSIIAESVRQFTFHDYSKNMTALNKYIKSNRVPTTYEKYLLEAARQVSADSFNLAIVQTVMILDWFANTIIESHLLYKIRKAFSNQRNFAEFIINQLWETSEEEKDKIKGKRKKGKGDSKVRIPTILKYKKFFPLLGIILPSDLLGKLIKTITLRNEIVHRIQFADIKESDARDAIDVGMKVIQFSTDKLIIG
jgi:hypothetical protein